MPDREKTIKGLMELHSSKETMDIIRDAIVLLREQEPEIVRCKDCKHWGTSDCAMYNTWGDDEPTPDDWFCPIGERRDDDA